MLEMQHPVMAMQRAEGVAHTLDGAANKKLYVVGIAAREEMRLEARERFAEHCQTPPIGSRDASRPMRASM